MTAKTFSSIILHDCASSNSQPLALRLKPFSIISCLPLRSCATELGTFGERDGELETAIEGADGIEGEYEGFPESIGQPSQPPTMIRAWSCLWKNLYQRFV
jgi:hypothetical protein